MCDPKKSANVESEISNTYMADSVKLQHSRFKEIKQEDVKHFVEAQPDVKGEAVIYDYRALKDGAGMSNGIIFFKVDVDLGEGIRHLDLVLRYAPGEAAVFKQKIFAHEYLNYRTAFKYGLPVPEVRWLDEDGTLLGTPGFVMDRVDAVAPAAAMYETGAIAEATPEVRKEMILECAGIVGKIRRLAIPETEVPHLLNRGSVGNTLFSREVSWWFYEAKQHEVENDTQLPILKQVHDWLIENEPKDLRPATFTHGDPEIANFMFRDNHVAALLDWELAHLGWQETDLMMVLINCETPKGSDQVIEGIPTEEEFIERYERESGCKVEYWPLFKLQMLYRWMCSAIYSRDWNAAHDAQWEMLTTKYLSILWPEAKAAAETYEKV